jgi:hypothetical protein
MFYHGIAKHKGDYTWLEPGQEGIITAYLPEQKTFAVHFGGQSWITFEDFTEEQFLEKFEVLDRPVEDQKSG